MFTHAFNPYTKEDIHEKGVRASARGARSVRGHEC